MRKLVFVFSSIAALSVAIPAWAEDAGAENVGVQGRPSGIGFDLDDVTIPHHDSGVIVERRTEGFGRSRDSSRCQVTIIRNEDGSTRRIERCRE